MRLEGEAAASSVDAQIDGAFPGQGDPVPIELEVDIRPAVPPWMNGALLEDAKRVLDTQEEGDLMGHPWRFEQLCRATGRLRIGDETYEIDGGANRIRRQSIRRARQVPRPRLAGRRCSRAVARFGYIAYPPRDDGKDTYNEGYLFDGDGDLDPGPRRRRRRGSGRSRRKGEDVSCVLETEDGRTRRRSTARRRCRPSW